MFESGYFADLTIRCGDHKWKAHKAIVCGQSEWFRKAFTGGFKVRTDAATMGGASRQRPSFPSSPSASSAKRARADPVDLSNGADTTPVVDLTNEPDTIATIDLTNVADNTPEAGAKDAKAKGAPSITLCPEQEELVQLALAGHNIFYTGAAGTGKSHVLQQMVARLGAQDKRVHVVASTGRAALNVGGTTTYAYLGIGLAVKIRPCCTRRTSQAIPRLSRAALGRRTSLSLTRSA